MVKHHRRFDRSTVTGSIPSKKSMRHMVHYRGLLQRAYIYLLEYSKNVLWYQEQPFAIEYQRANQTMQYTPDFRVILKDQPPLLITCAHDASAPKPATLAQWSAAQLWCNQHGYTFTLITWEVLRPHRVLLANLELLAVHSFLQIPPQTYDYTQKIILSFGGPFRIPELLQQVPLIPPLLMAIRSMKWYPL